MMGKAGKGQWMEGRRQWRAWLTANHATAAEIWLLFHKKRTGKPGLAYVDAVEEALCFGWIDGILKRIDDQKHMIRFSPRRSKSVWSQQNKGRVERLIAEARMTQAGLAKVTAAKASGEWDRATVREDTSVVPAELSEALAKNEKARLYFESLAPSYRRQFIYWIASAKRDETRRKRAEETIELLNRREKLGMR